MSWLIRRAIRLGPIRFNLAKSGIGTSIGVRGLRVGQDARGRPYLFGGAKGLYFRERLGGARPGGVNASAVLWLVVAIAAFLWLLFSVRKA